MNPRLAFLTPARLRLILSATLVLILAAGVGIFYVAYGKLSQSAVATGEQVANARESENTLTKLQAIKKELDSEQDAVNKAAQVVANSQNYTYQDTIINDLTIYAARAGLTISNITFTANPATATTTTDTATAVPGLKTASVTVTLQNPVDYTNLLSFLHYVEQNLTKLKLSRVNLTKSDNNGVTTDVLNLEVYVR